MKKFLVLRVYKYTTPSVVFQTDEENDALNIADIYSRTEGAEYRVASLVDA